MFLKETRLAQKNTKNPLPTLPFLLPWLCSKQLREWPSPVFLHPIAFSLHFWSSVISVHLYMSVQLSLYSIQHSTCSSTDLCNLRLAVGGISRQGFFYVDVLFLQLMFFLGGNFQRVVGEKTKLLHIPIFTQYVDIRTPESRRKAFYLSRYMNI